MDHIQSGILEHNYDPSQIESKPYWIVETDEGTFIYTDTSFRNLRGWYRATRVNTDDGDSTQGGQQQAGGSSLIDVYFDDFTIERYTSIQQLNDYYPFGVRIEPMSFSNAPQGSKEYLYNGGSEWVSELGLDQYIHRSAKRP